MDIFGPGLIGQGLLCYDPNMATTLNLSSLYAGIETELARVRELVAQQWTDAFKLVYGPSSVPPAPGGKLMRPALCFLSAGAAGAERVSHFVEMATAMELLHLAALAHDDVVDSANLRRGQTSLNALWDNHTAVLGGDYLVAQSLTILTKYDSCAVISSALRSIHEMAEGELINFGRAKGDLNEEDCLRLAKKKTASLFAVACTTPTCLLDAEDHEQALWDFGMGLGTAFQLVDDILDLEEDSSVLGKPSCGDIVEGKTTLPILYMREEMEDASAARLKSMVGREIAVEDQVWVAAQMKETGAHDRTWAIARKYIDEAHRALESMPSSQYTEAMAGIAEFVLVRHS